jgi:hypothetical protein
MVLTSIENELKKVGHDIQVAAKATEAAAAKVATALGKASPIVNQVLADADPAAATFAEFAESIAAKVIAFVGDAGNAVTAGGASVPLDALTISDAQGLYAELKSKTAPVASATVAAAPIASAAPLPAAA